MNNAQKAENKNEEKETPVVDMRKKVMRKSYKVTGYRVQAFAGGNSRNDRLKAEQTGNQLKVHFPEQRFMFISTLQDGFAEWATSAV